MAQLLMLYSTVDGHTLGITRRLERVVQEAGHRAVVEELTPATAVDPGDFDAALIGASIRYGRHRPEVEAFISRNAASLAGMPSAFFSVSAVARKPEKRTPETNAYVRKLLSRVPWQPDAIGIFGGRIAYPDYGFWEKHVIRFIMWVTRGPTDLEGTFEFTDWDQVAGFGGELVGLLDARPAGGNGGDSGPG